MLAMFFGAKSGASSITTRPAGSSMYSVLSGSSGRQSDGLEALMISPTVGLLAASAASAGEAASAASARIRHAFKGRGGVVGCIRSLLYGLAPQDMRERAL